MKSFTKTLLSGLADFRSVRPTWLSAQKLFRRSIVLRDSLFVSVYQMVLLFSTCAPSNVFLRVNENHV